MTRATPPGTLVLDERDRDLLAGEAGPGPALAMRVLTTVATAMGASRLIDVSSAHVDGCFYIGQVSLDFAERLVRDGARVSVPTTTNVGSVDLQHPGDWRGGTEFAAAATRLMTAYADLGCLPTWTCAPYQLLHRPGLGEHVAWGESNAIVFANSVLGARTQRYGDFVDISAAITGRAPYAGLHTDEGRLGDVLLHVDVPGRWRESEVFFPLLGHVVGRRVGSLVPVITGIDAASEDDLKAFGAAAASTGSVALFHVVGVTPEADDMRSCLKAEATSEPMVVGVDDLRLAWTELGRRASGRVEVVCLGTPHFSEAEFVVLAEHLRGRSVHAGTRLVVSTSRAVWTRIVATGLAEQLERSGVQIVTDTCTYNTPLLGQVEGLILTNSAKFAWYAPANIGAAVTLAGMATCVESAVSGRVEADPVA